MYKSCIHKVTFQCSRNIGNIQLESQLDRPKSNKSSLILRISDLLDLGLSSFDSHWIFHQYTSGKPSIYWHNISLSGAKPPRRDILHISLSRNIPLWIQTIIHRSFILSMIFTGNIFHIFHLHQGEVWICKYIVRGGVNIKNIL